MSLQLKLAKLGYGLRSSTFRRALKRGVAPAIEHLRILKSKPWQTIVDIGSNRGQFALASIGVHPSVVVHSFEPLSGPVKDFDRIFADVQSVHIHRCAVGTASHSAIMNISARDDSSSLLAISDTQTCIFPGTGLVGTESVQVRRLSDVLRPEDIVSPALLKLDVQGYEYNALLGCEDLLFCFNSIYVECSLVELYRGQHLFSEIDGWMHQRGFDLYDIGDLTRDSSGRMIQGDFLFERVS